MEKIIIANQKAYVDNLKDVLVFKNELYPYKDKFIIMPSDIYLNEFKDFNLGIQNISAKENGQDTGEVSVKQAVNYGIKYALIGHSEVRQRSLDKTNEKIKLCLKYGIKPILCVGENKNEDALETVKKQIDESLKDVTGDVIISYEPIWAINTGNVPSKENLEKIINYIKNLGYKVLYGGSITDENISYLVKIPNLDGFLIGKVSTDVLRFKKIIEVVSS